MEMEMASGSRVDVHIVMIPWLAFGHMIPYLELAIALAKSASIKISYISTPKNIQKLKPKVPPSLDHLINLVALPLLSVDLPLPDGIESTADIPMDKHQFLKVAFDLLKQPFKNFVTENSPDWIVVDCFAYWASEVAVECNIPSVFLSIISATTLVFLGPPDHIPSSPESFTSPPPWIDFPSTVAYSPCQGDDVLHGLYGEDATGMSYMCRVAKVTSACKAIAIRSCRELEDDYINLLGKLTGKHIIQVGLLPRSPSEEKDKEIEKNEAYIWLGQQKPKSVVYVSFGSEWKMTKEEVKEIANGLEKSGVPFLWALRTPIWAVKPDDEVLPQGFLDRTSDRSRSYIANWFPQTEILSHPSVGGSFFHGGWGTLVESLQFGHSLITLPLLYDHPIVSRMLVDKGLAIEVEKKEYNSFDGNSIAKALKLAMRSDSEEGKNLRVKATEISKVMGDKTRNDEYIRGLVEFFING